MRSPLPPGHKGRGRVSPLKVSVNVFWKRIVIKECHFDSISHTNWRCMWTKSKEFRRSLRGFILFYLICWLVTFLVVLEMYSIVTVLQLVCGYTLYVIRGISSLSGYSRYSGVPLSKTQDIDLQPLLGIVYSSCPGSWQLPDNFSKI